MEVRIVGGIIVSIILAVVVFVSKSGDKSRDDKGVRYEMLEFIAKTEAYKLERDYVETLFEEAHKPAFSNNYRLGRRYGSNRFNQDWYVDEVFGSMVDRAKAENHTKVAAALEKTRYARVGVSLLRR